MKEPHPTLREENEQLKALLAERTTQRDGLSAERDNLQALLEGMRKEHEAMVIRLTTEILALKRQLFGPKAERLKNAQAQQSLLDILQDMGRLQGGEVTAGERVEAMLGEQREESASRASEETGSERLKPPDKQLKKRTPHGRRKPEESKLPLERIVLEPLERKLEGGEALVKIGEETSSHLDYRPASVVRVEVVRPKYMRPEDVGTPSTSAKAPPAGPQTDEVAVHAQGEVSRAVDEEEKPAALVKVLVAEPPELPIAKGLAGPGLLALVLVMKYADHLPLYRQERIFKRQGVDLARSTLCGFVQGCYELLRHLVEAMWAQAKTGALLLTDACGILVRAKERCRRGSFQVFIAPGQHVLFAYLAQNNGPAVAELLKGFGGKLLSDASSVYHETYRQQPGVIEVSCWSHARRGLYKAYASAPELALVGIGFIGQLYDAHDASVDAATGRVDAAKRKQLAEPLLRELAAWLASERPKLVPTSPIEVALGYLERQWVGLTRFLDDGSLRLDNNPSELELRHQKVGLKNWLFCATDGGARWNAVIVSLIASCRMHDVEPLAYLRDVLTLLPGWKMDRLLELAPVNWRQTRQQPQTLQELQRRQLIRYDLDHGAPHSATASP